MPYIKQNHRPQVKPRVDFTANNAGELNFQITTLIIDYIEHYSLNYQAINDILGALEGAKLEFYRRIVVPYESEKIEENGDVYGV